MKNVAKKPNAANDTGADCRARDAAVLLHRLISDGNEVPLAVEAQLFRDVTSRTPSKLLEARHALDRIVAAVEPWNWPDGTGDAMRRMVESVHAALDAIGEVERDAMAVIAASNDARKSREAGGARGATGRAV